MKYQIQHKETKEILFGEWDSEYLYWNSTTGLIIDWIEYNNYEPLESTYSVLVKEDEINVYEIRSMNTNQLKIAIKQSEKKIEYHNKKVRSWTKRLNHLISKVNK